MYTVSKINSEHISYMCHLKHSSANVGAGQHRTVASKMLRGGFFELGAAGATWMEWLTHPNCSAQFQLFFWVDGGGSVA